MLEWVNVILSCALQIVIKDRTQRTATLREGFAKLGGIGKGHKVQHVERAQQRGILVIGGAQVHNFADGRVRIFPRRVVHRRIDRPSVCSARHIAVDGHTQ